MTAYEYYQSHSSKICKQLHSIGYTPHTIVEDAHHDGMDVWEYICLLLDIQL